MQQITEWLAKIGLERYAPAFVENDIDVSVLRYLTDADLEKIGVSLGHRRKLLAAIAELGGGPAAPTLPATDPRKQDAERTGPAPSVGPAAPPPRAASTESAERRYLTVMFCDLVGSTEISAQLDAEEWRDLVGSYLDAASAAVAEMGGHVAKKLGDGLLALFGYPLAHENDVERAVRAALSIQRALNELNRKNAGTGKSELTARIGLETGPVVVDAAGEIFGDAPNVAARVQALAEPGAVLVTGRVRREVAGLFVAEERGTRVLKGIPEPVALYRLVRASGAGRRSGQRQLTSLIGRDDEITMLTRRWERARQGDGQLVMIVGEPGLGKSRLIEEFHSRLSDTPHTWVEWSCSQLLQNTPLHPIAEWGRQRFGGGDVSAERRLADLESSLAQVRLDPAENVPLLAPLLDIPLPPDREPALAAEELRRRQLAALTNWVLAGARVQPVVLAFEDLHWADPTTLDVLRGIAERGALAPLFVVATTRPEFRPSWGMRSHHGTISLAPLDRAQVRDMVAELSARHALPHEVVEDVAARTGGVPLFVEEVTRLLLERGEQGGIHAIPPTLQQSLTARLDRLGPAREVAQIGAVIGRGFSYGLLRAVAGMDDAPLQAALEKLADADILLVQGLPPESEYRFKHALIQDAAYENLLRSRRQALHRRVAEMLRERFADSAAAQPEALAHHFTQAGMTDAAIEWWGKAGDQALRRSAFQEAISHLGKAIEMADKESGSTPRAAAAGSSGERLSLQTAYSSALDTERHGQRWFAAETHRVRGEILLRRDPSNTEPAEESFLTGIAIAQRQKARSYELRAALSLAKLYQSTNRTAEAHAVLAPALEGFSSTLEFPEIEEAQTLLAALAETDDVKNAAASRQRRLQLQTAYANALIHARGHGAQETSAAFAKAQTLATGLGDAADRFSACYGQWVGSLNRAEPLKMREAAAAFLHETARRPDSPEAGVAYRIAGLTHLYFGDYAAARADIEKALDVLDSERDRDLAFRFGQDQVAAAMIYLALVLWPLGDVGRARQFANQAASQAAKSGNVQTLAYVDYHLCLFEALRGDRQRASPVAKAVLDLARERAMPIWESAGRLLNGWANWLVGDQRMELAEMRRGIERWCELGQAWHRPYFGALLSEAEADAGNVDIAVTEVDRLLAEASSTGQHWSDAELHRIRGELLIKRDPANTAPAEEAFVTAIAVAREQKARSFELRAALALAKLHQSTGRPAEAHAALAPAFEGFLATPEFPEIEEAQNLLAALAQNDEVKKEIALRQRRFRLQTAYSNALLHGRGMSPPETTAAFAKARELAASIEDPVERFSAYYGLWVGPFIRGNLAQMREVAEAFMRDAERSPALPEAGIAHRLLGTTCWYTGDYAGARLHLDEALARYDHARDLHLTSSFAYDQGAVAEFYLGMTLYALGEIDRGACLVEDSLGLALQGGHIPTVALTRHYMIVFAAVRRDLDRATPHAQALLDLGLTHGLPSWHGFAKFTLAWALRRDNPQALVEMRAALTLQREMDFRVEQPLFGTLLAEAEAAAGERDAALATVVEQLAAIEQTGERWFAAEVHRARGEILLNRNPGNTAPAEEAFHTATAIAREQKAKSFELRAALSLAKLYQSGSRPLEAHAILASALEGFSPTPEFPEIAEARALLAALAS